jgi:hypothetical protein
MLVIPAKAGIQLLVREQKLDSSFRWNDKRKVSNEFEGSAIRKENGSRQRPQVVKRCRADALH